jgi:hypothetical protein
MILLPVCFSFSQIPVRTVEKGIHAIYGANVNVRNSQSLDSKVIKVLPIASKVEVIQKVSLPCKVNNVYDCWYKVKTGNDTGYVWGALIADHFLEDDFDQDGTKETFLVFCNAYYDGYGSFEYHELIYKQWKYEFKVARDTTLITQYKLTNGFENLYKCKSVKLKTFDQFTPPFTAICVTDSFIGGFWGIDEFYFRFHENNLDSLFRIVVDAGEGGIVQNEKMILPGDSSSVPNNLIIARAGAMLAVPEGEEVVWTHSREYYLWDGNKFNFLKTEKK